MNPVISSLEKLPSPPADLPWSDFDCAIVESAAAIELLDLSQPEQSAKVATFPGGVAFGLNSELRWLTRESGMHFVYISDEGRTLTEAEPTPLVAAQDDVPDRLYLWGMKNKDDNDFFETRIPRRLRYKAHEGMAHRQRMTVRLRHYLLSASAEHMEVGQAAPPAQLVRAVLQIEVPIFRLVNLEPAEAMHE